MHLENVSVCASNDVLRFRPVTSHTGREIHSTLQCGQFHSQGVVFGNIHVLL